MEGSLPSMLVKTAQDDGETIKMMDNQFNIKDYAKGAYLLLFFFPLGLKEDSEEVLKFDKSLSEFQELGCNVIGVTNGSQNQIKNWILRNNEAGGNGLGIKIIADEDLALSMSMGVAKRGVPSRLALLFDHNGMTRFSFTPISGFYDTQEILNNINKAKNADRIGVSIQAGLVKSKSKAVGRPRQKIVGVKASEYRVRNAKHKVRNCKMILEDLQKDLFSPLNAIIQAEGELKIAEDELQFALMDKQDAKYREKALASGVTGESNGVAKKRKEAERSLEKLQEVQDFFKKEGINFLIYLVIIICIWHVIMMK